MTRSFLLDLLERAGKTFAQAFLSSLIVAYTASGLDVGTVAWASWAKVLTAAVVAGLAAVASMLSSVLSGLRTGTASASVTVAQSVPAVGSHAAQPVDAPVVPDALAAMAAVHPMTNTNPAGASATVTTTTEGA